MSLYNNIRAALQTRAITAVGFPAAAQRAWEGVSFNPTIGTPWARLMLVPTEGRSAVVGAGTILHRGLFLVDLAYPARDDPGTGDLEAAIDAVKAVFGPGVSLTQGTETVSIEHAERGPVIPTSEWLLVSVSVAWHCYSPNN